MTISELMTHQLRSWDEPKVTGLFGLELARRILSIPLTLGQRADVRVWRRSALTSAPARDIVDLLRDRPLQSMDLSWIWKLPTHPRICLFIWKIARDRLPTCALLSGRGFPCQPYCPSCDTEIESVDHAIFLCPHAAQVWRLLFQVRLRDESVTCRISFLRKLYQESRQGSSHRSSLWAYTAYQIWQSRNLLLFQHIRISPAWLVAKARSLAAEFHHATPRVVCTRPGHWGSPAALAARRSTVFISWEPPPPGWVKVNFDGSVRGRNVGSAFVIRRDDGGMVAAGGFALLDTTVPMAELYAAWAGILYATRILCAPSIIIEGDSTTVIRWLRWDPSASMPRNPLLLDIWSCIQNHRRLIIRHIFREANAAADWVAGAASTQAGIWRWSPGDCCPAALHQILLSDSSGLTHTRSV